MGKKQKDEIPNPNSVANRDILQRLNFLYQAGVYLSGLGCSESPAAAPTVSEQQEPLSPAPHVLPAPSTSSDSEFPLSMMVKKQPRKHLRKFRKVSALDLSRTYIRVMKVVGQKTTVKMCVYVPLHMFSLILISD